MSAVKKDGAAPGICKKQAVSQKPPAVFFHAGAILSTGDGMKRHLSLFSFSVLLLLPVLLYTPDPRAVPAAGSAEVQAADGLKYVALTFDDGPRADTTAPLLDGLRIRGASATFFLIGQQIPGNEALLQRMAAEGHQIGNHTYSHVILEDAADNAIVEEIHKTQVLLEEILGPGDYSLRPPYGQVDRTLSSLIETPMIYWSLDPEDWKVLDAAQVAQTVTSAIQPGDIVLLHDFYPTSVEAALRIIDTLQPRGYAFVTVRDLFERYGTHPQPGELYRTATATPPW